MLPQLIEIKKLKPNKGQVKGLPKNPRVIRDDKFERLKQSIQDDPEMLELREVIAYDTGSELVVICGNMRLRVLSELGIKEVPVKILPTQTNIEKLKAYTIKDNIGYGEHDWEILKTDWDADELEEWGLDVPDWNQDEENDDDYSGSGKDESNMIAVVLSDEDYERWNRLKAQMDKFNDKNVILSLIKHHLNENDSE